MNRKPCCMRVHVLLLTWTLLLLVSAAATLLAMGPPAQRNPSDPAVWLDADGKPLPFQTGPEIQQFLRTATVIKKEKTPRGVTKPVKLLLEQDGVRAHANFRDVEIFEREWSGSRGTTRRNFRDSCLFECAAYELSQMLGLNTVPPVVTRRIDGNDGTLQIWVENSMTDEDRVKEKLQAPNPWHWNMQREVMHLFDALIFNDDRNLGNILITEDWRLWWIDHTRAFRTFNELARPEQVNFCEKDLWERIQRLDEEEVKVRLKDYLRSNEIKGLLKRRDALVKHIQELIDKKGERGVLFAFF